MTRVNSEHVVHGPTVDDETRCVHYRTPLDIIAIKFKCCGRYYPCHLCHQETESHAARQWPADEQDAQAILCGACKTELTISAYRATDNCPNCSAPFNPACALHADLYFESAVF